MTKNFQWISVQTKLSSNLNYNFLSVIVEYEQTAHCKTYRFIDNKFFEFNDEKFKQKIQIDNVLHDISCFGSFFSMS